MKQEMTAWQWHQLDHIQIICASLQTDNHASTSLLNPYRPDALPDAQPTVSRHCKHWRPLGSEVGEKKITLTLPNSTQKSRNYRRK